jgi:hypothetical protein
MELKVKGGQKVPIGNRREENIQRVTTRKKRKAPKRNAPSYMSYRKRRKAIVQYSQLSVYGCVCVSADESWRVWKICWSLTVYMRE